MKRLALYLLIAVWSLALISAYAAVDETNETARENALSLNELRLALYDPLTAVNELRKAMNTESTEGKHAFRLPASLQVIDDEAFMHTAIVAVDFPETLERIGENAFADIHGLRVVHISDNTKQIAKTAFSGSRNVKICASPNSYARTWAAANGIPFAGDCIITAGTGVIQIAGNMHKTRTQIDSDSKTATCDIEKKPQWRPVYEIHFEQCKKCVANHISGRAPPFCA